MLQLNSKEDQLEHIWDLKYEALVKLSKIHGTCNINTAAQKCVIADGSEVNIGTWLNTQRQMKKRGKLRADKLQKLQDLVDKGLLTWEFKHRHSGLSKSTNNSSSGTDCQTSGDDQHEIHTDLTS
jgi:hypothetical protein